MALTESESPIEPLPSNIQWDSYTASARSDSAMSLLLNVESVIVSLLKAPSWYYYIDPGQTIVEVINAPTEWVYKLVLWNRDAMLTEVRQAANLWVVLAVYYTRLYLANLLWDPIFCCNRSSLLFSYLITVCSQCVT